MTEPCRDGLRKASPIAMPPASNTRQSHKRKVINNPISHFGSIDETPLGAGGSQLGFAVVRCREGLNSASDRWLHTSLRAQFSGWAANIGV